MHKCPDDAVQERHVDELFIAIFCELLEHTVYERFFERRTQLVLEDIERELAALRVWVAQVEPVEVFEHSVHRAGKDCVVVPCAHEGANDILSIPNARKELRLNVIVQHSEVVIKYLSLVGRTLIA